MEAKKIIAFMAGYDSRNPMPFDALVEASGLQPATLQMMLDQMFNSIPTLINRAEHTKGGKTQVVYWPTGIKPQDGIFKWTNNSLSYLFKSPANTQPPRRSEQPRKAPEQPHQQENVMPREGKSRARVMLEYLAEHGQATNAKLIEISGATSVKPFIKNRINQGLIIKDGLIYRLADGVTPELLLEDRRLTNLPPPVIKPEKQQEQNHLQESNVLEFKRAEEVQQVTPQDLPERGMTTHDVCVDADGQLVIQLPGKVRMVFPAPDTKRIKAYLAAIDLEALCA